MKKVVRGGKADSAVCVPIVRGVKGIRRSVEELGAGVALPRCGDGGEGALIQCVKL